MLGSAFRIADRTWFEKFRKDLACADEADAVVVAFGVPEVGGFVDVLGISVPGMGTNAGAGAGGVAWIRASVFR